jgi:hypothetical protein
MARNHFGIPAYEGSQSRRIRLVRSENPKRGKAAIRYAQYRTGMSVREYVIACDALAVLNYALFDITWDTDRQFIELYD